MRNLKCIDSSTIGDEIDIIGTSWDASTDSIVCLRAYSTPQLYLQRWNGKELLQIACWDGPDVGGFPLIDFHFFGDSTACIISRDGDLIYFKEYPSDGEERIEIVGSIDAGISAAAWSPDEDILVVATKASTLIYLTRDFEELATVALSPQDLDVSDHVSVGWGKKETQFKGKNARALRDPTVPEIVDAGHLAEGYDHGETTISWRGDGAYIAINSIEVSNQRRVVRIYSREGILESVTEPVNGLLGTLSWRPAGNLLAGVQNFEDQFKVVFFERNGLRHGQFDLRTKWLKESFVSLHWNVDSTILAVCYEERIQLWTMSNYYWYLKQDITSPPGKDADDLMFKWHPENPIRFLVSNSKGIQSYQYAFEVSASPITPPFDYGVVAVIDGRSLKVTPFRHANIPPPMSLYDIKLLEDANDVDIILHTDHSKSEKPALEIRILHLTTITRWLLNSSFSEPPEYLGKIDPDEEVALYDSWRPLAFRCQSSLPEASRFHLTDNGSLLDNQQVLARGCTSFLLTPSHLIFTTSQHLLKFVHLAPTEDLQIPPDTPESDERCRSIERGARLITAMPSIFAVLLQMTRGNLETIYPRALVLAGIRKDINDKKYKKAFLACRTQRVDLNIIHDHDAQQFINSVGLFIDQVRKVEHIDLFLSSLK